MQHKEGKYYSVSHNIEVGGVIRITIDRFAEALTEPGSEVPTRLMRQVGGTHILINDNGSTFDVHKWNQTTALSEVALRVLLFQLLATDANLDADKANRLIEAAVKEADNDPYGGEVEDDSDYTYTFVVESWADYGEEGRLQVRLYDEAACTEKSLVLDEVNAEAVFTVVRPEYSDEVPRRLYMVQATWGELRGLLINELLGRLGDEIESVLSKIDTQLEIISGGEYEPSDDQELVMMERFSRELETVSPSDFLE